MTFKKNMASRNRRIEDSIIDKQNDKRVSNWFWLIYSALVVLVFIGFLFTGEARAHEDGTYGKVGFAFIDNYQYKTGVEKLCVGHKGCYNIDTYSTSNKLVTLRFGVRYGANDFYLSHSSDPTTGDDKGFNMLGWEYEF